MADIIHNLSVGGTSRPLGTVHYIEGTGTTAGTWLGSDPSITAYYDGLTIAYKVNVAGASTTTLNINSLGAKTVRRNASNLTTHYPVNSVVHLTYTTIDGTSYWQCADYDTDADKKTTSSNTSSKIFLVGATTQSTSGQTTYSHDTAYVGTDGCLYSNKTKVSVEGHTHSDYVSKSSTDVQCISGGIVVGKSSTADLSGVGTGRIMFTGQTNPLIGLQAVASDGTLKTPFFVQSLAGDDCLYIGPTSAKALKFDTNGNMTSSSNLDIGGTIKMGGTLVSKTGHTHTVSGIPTSASFTGTTATLTTSAASNTTVSTSSHTHTTTSTGSYTPEGTISAPAFTGKAKASGGPSATTAVASSSHTHTVTSSGSYTPAGTIAAPTFTGSAKASGGPSATTTVASSAHTHTLSASIANNCMTIATPTGTPSATATVPTYNHTHSVTAAGTVSAPTFTGTAATISVSGTTATPSATATVPTYNHTHSVTASGTIAAPTFTGTAATISVSGTSGGPSATVNVAAASHTHTVTHQPAGSVSLTTGSKTTSASTN